MWFIRIQQDNSAGSCAMLRATVRKCLQAAFDDTQDEVVMDMAGKFLVHIVRMEELDTINVGAGIKNWLFLYFAGPQPCRTPKRYKLPNLQFFLFVPPRRG